MDYSQTRDWLFNQLPIFQRIGAAAYKADLTTTIQLLDQIDNPQKKFKAIHIAGTNGKGSVSHMLASVLQEAGYKTGLYTSPHLKDFRERIRINGEMISEQQVIDFVAANKSIFEALKPSFFEMTVGMAYDHFAREKVDFAVLETGMGGRLDSTNICYPVITTITNIGLDHTQYLGDTLEKIAVEKAGIIKENIPVVIGRRQPQTAAVFESAALSKNAPLSWAEDHFDLKTLQTRNSNALFFDVWKNNQLFIEEFESPLKGTYQSENIATVLQTLDVLKNRGDMNLEKSDIVNGLEDVVKKTGLSGRWQILQKNPLTICDTGHNEDGIRAVVRQLSQTSYDHLHFVFGMVNDKNPESILYLLPKNATYYFCKPDIPRGLNQEELAAHAFKAGLRGEAYESVTQALNSAMNSARANDLVFIGGSTFVVAEVV